MDPPATDVSTDELRAALEVANIPVLLLVLRQLTGDQRWLEEPYRPTRTIAVDDNDTGGLSEPRQREVRDAAFRVLRDRHAADHEDRPRPSEAELIEWLSISLGERVPDEYAPSMMEEGGFTDRLAGLEWENGRPGAADEFPVAVIGAGMAGICAGVYLRKLGLPYLILERNHDLGGVWFDNDYPGAGVDTPSQLYSYSFAQNPGWSRYYPKQKEILGYFRRVATEYEVTQHIRFGHEVTRATWHSDGQQWIVEARDDAGEPTEFRARAVISCVGLLNEPSVPHFDGIEEFEGAVFHSARWDHGVDLAGKRVAVIGTGASSMQIVPAIAGTAAEVVIFQRSPQWVIPNPNYLRDIDERVRLLMERVPYYLSFYRLRLIWMWQDKLLATLHRDPDWPHADRSVNETNDKHRRFISRYMLDQLGERADLAERVIPDYPPYGKRILMDNRWIETLKRSDVHLVPQGVRRFARDGVVADDGSLHPVDVAVLATGFKATEMLRSFEVRGRSGRTLHDAWDGNNAYAYLGITVPDFPNLFLVGGPNTFLGHGGSAIFTTECAVSYIVRLLRQMIEQDIDSVEVREDVTRAYTNALDARHEQLIWTHPGMTTWFRNSAGRVVVVSPWRGVDYWRMTSQPDLSSYRVRVRTKSGQTPSVVSQKDPGD